MADLPLSEVCGLARRAIPRDPETWCGAALEIMPVVVLLLNEWCILSNPGQTAEAALMIAHLEGR